MSRNFKFFRVLFPFVVCALFLYLFNFKERIAHNPKFVVGNLISYACGSGRSKGQLDFVIENSGGRQRIITSLFGYTQSGWIQCENLQLSEKLGEVVIFGETDVSWDYLKIGGVEIHSLEALINQINNGTSTVWDPEIDWGTNLIMVKEHLKLLNSSYQTKSN